MQLVFPKGERSPLPVGEGNMLVGSAADCDLVLAVAGVAPRHAALRCRGERMMVEPLDPAAVTVVNGQRVHGASPVHAGDVVMFGSAGCVLSHARMYSTARSRQSLPPPVTQPMPEVVTDSHGVLPKVVLRGVSGPVLGRSFVVRDGMVLGRQGDCDVVIEAQGISRRHARIHLHGAAVRVDDLDSTNGSFVNGRRVATGPLRPGDELTLDNVRFVLVAPQDTTMAKPRRVAGWGLPLLVALLVLLALALGALWT